MFVLSSERILLHSPDNSFLELVFTILFCYKIGRLQFKRFYFGIPSLYSFYKEMAEYRSPIVVHVNHMHVFVFTIIILPTESVQFEQAYELSCVFIAILDS